MMSRGVVADSVVALIRERWRRQEVREPTPPPFASFFYLLPLTLLGLPSDVQFFSHFLPPPHPPLTARLPIFPTPASACLRRCSSLKVPGLLVTFPVFGAAYLSSSCQIACKSPSAGICWGGG